MNYECENENFLRESLSFMSVLAILLTLELTLFYDLDNYDQFSSFDVMKGPDDDSLFQNKTLSFIETVALMAMCSHFHSCTTHFTYFKHLTCLNH